MSGGSLWDRLVALTIKVGEWVLAPVERFIGRRSLVGDETFFPVDRFPWVKHIEANWHVILQELEGVLAGPRRASELPGHLQGSDRDHRR